MLMMTMLSQWPISPAYWLVVQNLSCSAYMNVSLSLPPFIYASLRLSFFPFSPLPLAFHNALCASPCAPPLPPRRRLLLLLLRRERAHVTSWRPSFKYNIRMPWYARLVLAKNIIWHDVLQADQTAKVRIDYLFFTLVYVTTMI